MTRESQVHSHFCPKCGQMKPHDPNEGCKRIYRSSCLPSVPRICNDCVRAFLANALPIVLALGRGA